MTAASEHSSSVVETRRRWCWRRTTSSSTRAASTPSTPSTTTSLHRPTPFVAKRLTGETFDDTTLIQHLDADDSVELVGSTDQFRVLTGEAGDALNLASDSLAEV